MTVKELETAFETLEERQTRTEERVTQIEGRVDDIDTQLDCLAATVEQFTNSVTSFKMSFMRLVRTLESVQKSKPIMFQTIFGILSCFLIIETIEPTESVCCPHHQDDFPESTIAW